MITDNLLRDFKATESSHPYIIPALKNGLTVTVAERVAREFRIQNPGIVVGGTCYDIEFKKIELGLWEMKLNK